MLRLSILALALAPLITACDRNEKPAPPAASAPATPEAAPAKSAMQTRDPQAAREQIAKGAVVIDVRTAEEYGQEHLPQATNIPLDELPTKVAEVEKLLGGDKSKPVVLYCGTGFRAGKAKRALDAAGFTHVINGGGLDDLR
jgi:phage shock protein E